MPTAGALRRTLVERQADVKGDAAYHSGRVIGAVDAQNAAMNAEKKRRADQVAADTRALAKVAAEVERIMERYRPIVARLEASRAQRAALRSHLARAHDELLGLAGRSHGQARASQGEEAQHRRRAASAQLRAARGYTMDPGTTPNRYGRACAPRAAWAAAGGAGAGTVTMRSRGGTGTRRGGGLRAGSRSGAGLGLTGGSSSGVQRPRTTGGGGRR